MGTMPGTSYGVKLPEPIGLKDQDGKELFSKMWDRRPTPTTA
jgi:hypothetical protein